MAKARLRKNTQITVASIGRFQRLVVEQERERLLAEARKYNEKPDVEPGTAGTILKLRQPPLDGLIKKKKIPPVAITAAQEYELALRTLWMGLSIGPQSWERKDRGEPMPMAKKAAIALDHYGIWKDHWSVRSKRGDPTCEIVYAAVIDLRSFDSIDRDMEIGHGKAAKATVYGLMDYAARAEMMSREDAKFWMWKAENVFKLRPI